MTEIKNQGGLETGREGATATTAAAPPLGEQEKKFLNQADQKNPHKTLQGLAELDPVNPARPVVRMAGEPVPEKVVNFGGKFYRDSEPPKMVTNPDGTKGYIGKELNPDQIDEIYAENFWAGHDDNRDVLEAFMKRRLQTAADGSGNIEVIATTGGLEERHKQEISAYRVLADEMGLDIGKFKLDKDTGAAMAEVKKKDKDTDNSKQDEPREEQDNKTKADSGTKEVEQPNAPFTPEEVGLLKSIHDKCTQEFPGEKYPNALFGVQVNLTEQETDLVGKLVQEASNDHAKLVAQTPKYDTFQTLLEERRKQAGALYEAKAVEENPNATEPNLMNKPGKGLIIEVPPNIFQLYSWEKRIRSLESALDNYKKGLANKQMSQHFGEGVQDVYWFVKQSRNQSTQPQQA